MSRGGHHTVASRTVMAACSTRRARLSYVTGLLKNEQVFHIAGCGNPVRPNDGDQAIPDRSTAHFASETPGLAIQRGVQRDNHRMLNVTIECGQNLIKRNGSFRPGTKCL